MEDKRVIACSIIEPNKTAKGGALAYFGCTSGGAMSMGRVQLLIRSRGGRFIEKWEAIKRVGNFRFKTLPPEHPLYGDTRITDYADEETLESLKRYQKEYAQ